MANCKMTTHKDSSRESRLHWTNQAEHTLRKELNDIALQKCRDQVENFVACSKEVGLLVVFKCREQNAEMNQCLRQYTNDEAFQEFKKEREKTIILK